mgnify:CR=1 FL=1
MVFEAIDMILGGMDEEDPEGRKAFLQLDGLFEMKFGGSYKLDNGDGLEDTSDDTHRWEVRTWPKAAPGEVECATHAAVAAVGTTPFGRFVSLGVIDGSTMTLARRYIADDDPRAAWASPAAVLDAVLGEGPLALDEILLPDLHADTLSVLRPLVVAFGSGGREIHRLPLFRSVFFFF